MCTIQGFQWYQHWWWSVIFTTCPFGLKVYSISTKSGQISGLENPFLQFRNFYDVKEQKKDWRMLLSFGEKEMLDRNLHFGTGEHHLKRPYHVTINISRSRKSRRRGFWPEILQLL